MKTIAQIYIELRAEFATALADQRPCYDLTPSELENGALAAMIWESGRQAAKSYLNLGSQWNMLVSSAAEQLVDELAQLRAETEGLGQWDDLQSFLSRVVSLTMEPTSFVKL